MPTSDQLKKFKFLTPEKFSTEKITETANESEDIKKYLLNSGFALIKGAFDSSKLKIIKTLFESRIIKSKSAFPRVSGYRSLETNKFTDKKFISNAFMNMQLEDPCSYTQDENKFINSILNLIINGSHINQLRHALGCENLELLTWNFFHSVSPCSAPHQDCSFFDPRAKNMQILGIWIAVEDIDPCSSPLYLQRASHLNLRINSTIVNDFSPEYLDFFRASLLERQEDIVAPVLKSGDCIIWDANTVHGSLWKSNPDLSRMSITAHFKAREKSLLKKLLSLKASPQFNRQKNRLKDFLEIGKFTGANQVSYLMSRARRNQ